MRSDDDADRTTIVSEVDGMSIAIISMLLTPTPDPLTMILMMVLLLLYGLGVGLCYWNRPKATMEIAT